MKIRGAFLAAKPVKQITEKFRLQEFFLDCSNYNQMTGEKYDNYCCLQIVNDKLSLDGIHPGQVVDVEFYLNGRTFKRQDGTPGFMQNLNAHKIEPALNTAGEKIVFSEEQLVKSNLEILNYLNNG